MSRASSPGHRGVGPWFGVLIVLALGWPVAPCGAQGHPPLEAGQRIRFRTASVHDRRIEGLVARITPDTLEYILTEHRKPVAGVPALRVLTAEITELDRSTKVGPTPLEYAVGGIIVAAGVGAGWAVARSLSSGEPDCSGQDILEPCPGEINQSLVEIGGIIVGGLLGAVAARLVVGGEDWESLPREAWTASVALGPWRDGVRVMTALRF